MIAALICFSPVIYWNTTHSFASFGFQTTRRLESTLKFSLQDIFLNGIYLLTPPLFIALLIAPLSRWFREKRVSQSGLFSCAVVILPMSIFIFYSLRHVPKLNWIGPSLIGGIPLLSVWLTSVWSCESANPLTGIERLVKKTVVPTLVLWIAIIGVGLQYFSYGFPVVPYSQSMHRFIGWESMTQSVLEISKKVASETNAQPILLGMDKHTIAAELLYYGTKAVGETSILGRVGSRNIIGEEALMFRYWGDPESFIGKPMILVAKDEDDLSDAKLTGFFSKLDPILPIETVTNGHRTKKYLYRIGYGYVGPEAQRSTINETPPQVNRS